MPHKLNVDILKDLCYVLKEVCVCVGGIVLAFIIQDSMGY